MGRMGLVGIEEIMNIKVQVCDAEKVKRQS